MTTLKTKTRKPVNSKALIAAALGNDSGSKVESGTKKQSNKKTEQQLDNLITRTVALLSPEKGNRYGSMRGACMAAYTASAFQIAGFVRISSTGIVSKSDTIGNASALRGIMGPSAYNYWKRNGLFTTDGRMTDKGILKLQGRINNTESVHTTMETIRAFYIAMVTGKDNARKITVDNKEYVFDSPFTFTVRKVSA